MLPTLVSCDASPRILHYPAFLSSYRQSESRSCSSVGEGATVNNSPIPVDSPSRTPSTSTPLREPASSNSTSLAASSNVNFVSRLQEWAQGRGLLFPVYREIQSNEMRNPFCFVVSVPTKESVEGRGVGRTKMEAKQVAAKALYEALSSSSDGYASVSGRACLTPLSHISPLPLF